MKQIRPLALVGIDGRLDTCTFPFTLTENCPRAIPEEPPRPGGPRKYCDDPDHTAVKALRRRDKLMREAELQQPAPEPTPHPVSDGVHTLASLLTRMEQFHAGVAALVTDVGELVAAVTSPEALDHEVTAIRRDAELQVAEAHSAQTAAETLARAADQRCILAVSSEKLAREAVDEMAARVVEADARVDRVTTQAGEAIGAAREDRDRIQAHASAETDAMLAELDTANTARTRAEAERDAALATAETTRTDMVGLRAENTDLRERLDEQQRAHNAILHETFASHSLALADASKQADATAREVRGQHAHTIRQMREDFKGQLAGLRADYEDTVQQLQQRAEATAPAPTQ